MLIWEANRLRVHYLRVLQELVPTTFLTFNFGYKIGPISAQKSMTTFFNVMQRRVYGRKWFLQDHPWPVAYGFFEHPNTNPHYHVLARLEPELMEWAGMHGHAKWQKLQKRGQLDVQEIYAPDGIWSYCTKRLASQKTFEDVWVYTDMRERTTGKTQLVVGRES